MAALRKFAAEVNDLYGVACSFECRTPVPIGDVDAATHLLHIVREAVNNALRHGHPRTVVISLTATAGQGRLLVEDDGDGACPRATHQGMGLHIMSYRASMIGGSLRSPRTRRRRHRRQLHISDEGPRMTGRCSRRW